MLLSPLFPRPAGSVPPPQGVDPGMGRVLLVDDDPRVLDALVRTLRRRFEVVPALGPAVGIRALEDGPDFAVVVSDLRMPGSDGVTFLTWAREMAPDTVRILLTGEADVASAIAAVNDGAIFRFLAKPCPAPLLLETVEAAAARSRAIRAERTLLAETRRGSLRALAHLLELARPSAAQRAERIRTLALELAEAAGMEGPWQVEVAAMLSQLGALALPERDEELAVRLGPDALHSVPEIASRVVGNLPEMEAVSEILLCQHLHFDGGGAPRGTPRAKAIPLGARILRIAADCVALEAHRISGAQAVDRLRERPGWYDPDLLDHLSELHGDGSRQNAVLEVELRAVQPGMVFAEEVRTSTGVLLVARGREATPRMIDRIRSLEPHIPLRERVYVLAPVGTPG